MISNINIFAENISETKKNELAKAVEYEELDLKKSVLEKTIKNYREKLDRKKISEDEKSVLLKTIRDNEDEYQDLAGRMNDLKDIHNYVVNKIYEPSKQYINNTDSIRNVLRLISISESTKQREYLYIIVNADEVIDKMKKMNLESLDYRPSLFELQKLPPKVQYEFSTLISSIFSIPQPNEYTKKVRIKLKTPEILNAFRIFKDYRYKTRNLLSAIKKNKTYCMTDYEYKKYLVDLCFIFLNKMILKENANRDEEAKLKIHVYYRLSNKCVTEHHRIESKTLEVQNAKNGEMISLNVFYCQKCKKYFMNYEVLQNLISKDKFPKVSLIFDKNNMNGLKEISVLRLLGYNVKEGAYSDKERQQLLKWIIDNNIMTKSDIINNLEFKINYNGKKKGNERACLRWKDDIEYVSRYIEDNEESVDENFSFEM